MADELAVAMDVHMNGISYSTNQHQLVAELSKILHQPPYAFFSSVMGPVNFHVYLFKDHRGGKAHSGSGSLTLLRNVALHFLQEFGEQPNGQPPPKSFSIGGRRVKFSKGRGKPRLDVVERIQRFPYVDPMAAAEKENRTNILQNETIPLRTLQFGWNCRDSVFSVEWEEDIVGSSLQVDDERREIRIAIPRPDQTLFIAIRFARISYIQIHSELSTNDPIIFFNLWYPPNYESTTGSGLRQRLSHLPMSDHERVAPFTSLAIRLICGNRRDLGRFQRLAKTARIHNVYDTELHIERRGLFSAKVLKQVQNQIAELRWSVAFQVEALFRNLDLDATEILRIIPVVRRLVESEGRSYTTSFLRHFGTRARYWSSFGLDTSQTIEQFLAQLHTEYSGSHAMAPSLQPTDESIFQSLHVVISPTTIYLEGPFVKRSNRVIRSFHSKSHDSFLRVSFVDEENLQYRFDRELDCVAFTRSRVGEFLIDKGLTIAGRKFSFLAYSQSALKEHAVWFVRPFKDDNDDQVDARSIIKNLGSFDGLKIEPRLIYCPARYAARISQAFTATDATSIEVDEVIYLQDISTTSGQYNFTDGVGTMSLELAEAIWNELRASRRRKRRVKNPPRALQIRFEGSKGMLSVDYRLKGHVFCLRPSMIKFTTAQSQTIEIARAFDKPGPYYLNRPLIMLLEGLGVPYEAFKVYQDKAVREAQESTKSLQTFANMLETHGLGTSYRLPSVMLGLTQLDIDTLSGNAFYQKMLDYAVHHVLRLLKTKARIPIPHGVTVVGVADVHKFLKEGDIFVCTRAPDSNRLNYIEGPVLISRSPTIHPGDVQLVNAIGKPPSGSPFAHEPLPNTVVFSVLGKRPLPSCCGGGDLDGDTYNIIPLNKCPAFRPERTFEPGKYAAAPKKYLDHPSTIIDVAEFVIEYINSHVLGIVSINWLLIADQSEAGILDPDCMKLAALHSDAVDYPKSGQPVAKNTIPKPKSPLKPDWHAPEVNVDLADYYPSTRAIGKLFRDIVLPEIPPGTFSHFERRMIKEGRMQAPQVDNLADTLDGFDLNDDPIVLAIEAHVGRYIRTKARPAETVEYIAQIFSRYASELMGICVAHTLSHGKTALLSEEEAVVGTIVAKSSQPRKRTDLIAGLREKTDFLVRGVKEELMGDDNVTSKECLRRAWLSFELAIGEGKSFGAQSFIWIALGVIFDAIKELEEEAKESRSSRSSRRL
ncbi:RNA dependent RNA polymerase-domain-containing protein [Mycena epipterygia]|nr:RNA dependent RNA polymerase-domain-containing protein [Mycena epipterygia]